MRQLGYAHTAEEYCLGDYSIAAAVVDDAGVAINIAVAGPRWQAETDEKRFADLLVSTVASIAGQRMLGY
ncbi:hypothetical protein [Cupriavidus basilensis]|uniref:hypothetical protein n=1 Tax=Cupriavidus basilensis TaxID=68895 RepID=UPI0039F6F4EF